MRPGRWPVLCLRSLCAAAAGGALAALAACNAGAPTASGLAERIGGGAAKSLATLEGFTEKHWQKVLQRLGFRPPRHIVAYRGYGNGETLWGRGRLLSNEVPAAPRDDAGWWENLRASYTRWESDDIAGAEVRLAYMDQSKRVTTDDEGYYAVSFTVDEGYPGTAVVTAEHRTERAARPDSN